MAIDIVGKLLKVESQVNRIICNDLNTEIKHTFLVSEEDYDPDNPLEGWESPKRPVLRDTVSVLFNDNITVNYTYIVGEGNINSWEVTYVNPIIPNEITITSQNSNIDIVEKVNDDSSINYDLDYDISNKLKIESIDNSVEVLRIMDDPDYSLYYDLSIQPDIQSKKVYVEATNGDDATGLRGYRHFPFKTLNAALAVLQAGDTLHVFPGDYYSSTYSNYPFNIYCEDGVNWDLRFKLSPNSLYNEAGRDFNFRFDNIYSTTVGIYQQLLVSAPSVRNLIVEANKMEYIYIPSGKFLDLKVKLFKNSLVLPGSNIETNSNAIVEIDTFEMDNPLRQGYVGNQSGFTGDNSSIRINNININNNVHGDGGIINLGRSTDTGTNKNITAKINNCRYTPLSIYEVPPNPWYTATLIGLNNFYPHSWMEGVNFTGNQVFWVRDGAVNGTNVNYELKNYRGTGHGFNMYGWNFDTPLTSPTVQRVVNVKIQGYWEKGIPVSLRWNGGPQNTIVNVELDVICDTSMGVAFWCTGGIHESNRFNISGKIVTKSPGIPCITISGIAESAGGNIQTNNTITLKDLLLINDGTIQPIMVNPLYTPQVQEVNIMNVKSNSLIVDTNITEIGESITRNVKYK